MKMQNPTTRTALLLSKGLIILTGLFFLLSGYFEISKHPATYPKTLAMGYPPYFIQALGIAKILGVAALWQSWYRWLKELAFAGFMFDVTFAFISGCAINSYPDCIKAVIVFILLTFLYYRFKTRDQQ